jgi:hypothetical protein
MCGFHDKRVCLSKSGGKATDNNKNTEEMCQIYLNYESLMFYITGPSLTFLPLGNVSVIHILKSINWPE